MKSRLEYALTLARLGFRIFPLQPGSKKPYRGTGWRAIATTNEPQIRAWFEEFPDMNYAVNCTDQHVILDIDEGGPKNKQGKMHFLRAEDAALGLVEQSIFDATFKVRSPKGGFHLYFNAKHGYSNSVSTVIDDCDVRGPDGYVVGPGCATFDDPENNTVEGQYFVETDGIADLPAWLEVLLDREGVVGVRASNAGTAAHPVDTKSGIDQAMQTLRHRKPAIQNAHGDEETYQCALALKDKGVSPEVCFDLMFNKILFAPDKDYPQGRTWNETCDPPWREPGLREKIRNAYSYGNKPIGAKMDALAAYGDEEEGAVAPPAVDGMDEMQRMLEPGEHFSAIEQPIGNDGSRERIKNMLMSPDDFLARPMEFDGLVYRWFPAQGVCAVLATRNTGKSVVLEDFCFRVSCDMTWNGLDIAKGWACVYLCGEDDRGLMANFAAWKIKNNRSPAPDRLILAPAVPDLMDAENVKLWAEELLKKLGGRKVVVFIDTWQRATSSASQNDDKEMQRAIAHAEAIARHLKGCAIIAFHPPKGRDDTISGSMVLENSTTAILNIIESGTSGQKKITVVRIKGHKEGSYAFFKIKEEAIAQMDKQGNEVTGALPEYEGGNRQGHAQERVIADQEARSEIVGLLLNILRTRKQPMSMKEIALVVEKAITAKPDGVMARYFPNSRSATDIEALLPKLFTAETDTPILNTIDFVRCVNGKLVYVNGENAVG